MIKPVVVWSPDCEKWVEDMLDLIPELEPLKPVEKKASSD